MSAFDYGAATITIPDRMRDSHRRLWETLSQPGHWWSGAERIAIAAEMRRAGDCAFCRDCKAALSYAAVSGEHETDGTLPAASVEAVHRVVTDSGRLSKDWCHGVLESGLQDTAYAELIGIVTSVLSLDDVHRGVGLPLEPLPNPIPGEPEQRRPSGARALGAWIDLVPAEALDSEDADIYQGMPDPPNIVRAMSLAPNEVRIMLDIHEAHYLSLEQMMSGTFDRVLSRPQMEIIAGRVSVLNECFY